MGEPWAQWLRLPLQLPLIAWAWRYTARRINFRNMGCPTLVMK